MKSEDIIKVENLNRGKGFAIRWSLTYLCNYNCAFCIQGDKETHIEKAKNESAENRQKICDNLINFIETKLNKKYEKIDLYLIGGEVTILSDFLEIVKKIVNCKFEGKIAIRITTNLSTSNEVLENLVEIFNQKMPYLRELHVNASYYKEFAKEEEFISKIKILTQNTKFSNAISYNSFSKKMKKALKRIKVLNKLKNKIKKIYVSIGYPLVEDKDYEEYLEFKKKYKNITKNIHFIVIRGYKNGISDKIKNKIVKQEKQDQNIKVTFKNGEVFYCQNNNKISLKLEGEQCFNSKGYLCDIGINNFTISSNGDISRCVSCRELTKIGNMLNDNFELPKEKFFCPSKECNCNYYGVIEKR